MKKQFDEDEKKRLQALKKRRRPEVPTTDFTYAFNGDIMKKSPRQSK